MTITRRTLLGTGAVLGLATACGSNTGRDGGGSGRGKGPRLSQWYHQYGEPGTEQAVRRYAAAYDKADVTVQWRPGNYDEQTAAALLTDSGPDVFEVNGPTVDQIQGGQVLDVTDLIADVKDDFNPAVLTPKTYDGRIWGIPQVIDMQMLYYRKSLLDDAGVRPPRTLDELVDAAKALTTKRQKGLFLGNDGGAGALGITPLHAAGLTAVTDDGKPGFDDPAAARALARFRQLYADESLLLGAPADWSDPSAFVQGLTAMQWTGLWALPAVRKELKDDFGVLALPAAGPHGRPAVPVGAYGAAVSARSEHKEAAKAFVKWLWVDRTDHQEDFALSYGFHIPARLSLAKKAGKLREGPAADAVRFSTEHGRAEPLLWTPANRTAYQDAFSRIVKSGANPESELKAVVRKVAKELDRVKNRKRKSS